MGKLEGSGGDTEESRCSSSRGVKEIGFCRTQSPQCSSGVSEAGHLDSAEVERSGETGRPQAPGPLAASLAGGFRMLWGFLPGAGGVGPCFLEKFSPWAQADFHGCLSLPAVAVSVPMPIGIRELLAALTDILLLTANARRGCFHGNTGQGGQLALGLCGLRAGSHLWFPPSSPFLVLGPGVLHNGVRGCRLLFREDLPSQRPELFTGMS